MILSLNLRSTPATATKAADMAVSNAVEQRFHVRSISMPTRTHHTPRKVQEEIQKLALLASSCSESSPIPAETLYNGLKGLDGLYMSIEDLVSLPSIQQSLRSSSERRWLDEEVDASIRLLDVCVSAKDALLALKEHVHGLQSAMRRKGEVITAEQLMPCIQLRKKAKKIINICSKESRRSSSKSTLVAHDCDVSEVFTGLTEARKITLSLLCSVASFMTVAAQMQRSSTWSFVSKIMHKRKVACEEADCGRSLELLQHSIWNLDKGLECLFKRLIQNRVSLLNLLSF